MSFEALDDCTNKYTPEEQRELSLHLLDLTCNTDAGAFSAVPMGIPLLRQLHATLFSGVRDHAGRIREPGFGSERLNYGPHRSEHRDLVPGKLAEVFERARAMVDSLLAHPDDPQYEASGLHIAAWLHAEVIRIHPFEDGNGRTSRLLMGIVLVRAGFRQIPIEVCKQEYLDCLNHYYETNEIAPLLDLYLRVDMGYA